MFTGVQTRACILEKSAFISFFPLPFVHAPSFIGGNSHTIWRDFSHRRWIPGTRDPSCGCVSGNTAMTYNESLGLGKTMNDPHLVPQPVADCDVSLSRCLMWKPLTFGWPCVSCLCLPPCWSTPQSTLSRGNTRSSSGWGKSSGSRG